jgi:4-amino-4-deoxy-L-arabinose transferase-like glycosyltransferase
VSAGVPAPAGRLARWRARLAATTRTGRARLGAAVAGVYLVVQVAGLPGIGLTDDDDFYIPAGRGYAQWLARAVSGPFHGDFSAWTKAGVWTHWSCPRCNREHPPFAKWVIGAGVYLLADTLGVLPDYQAGRVGIVLLSTLLAWLVFRMAYDAFGALAGVFSAAALLTMPRFYFHSHAPTLDVAIAFTYFLTVYAFFRARLSFGWGIFAGVAFGLALLTKVNAPFAVLPLGLFWLLRIRGAKVENGNLVLAPVNVALPAMLVFGPLLFFALWPRLWFEPFRNLVEYAQFHLQHYGIYFYYFGTIYGDSFAPWHAPFVMAGITTPLVTVALGLGGAGLALHRALRRRPREPEAQERRDLGVLLLLNAATSIGIVAFLNVPKYGGVKLFLPFFPFLALFSGMAFAALVEAARRRIPALARRPRLAAAGALVFFAGPAAIDLWRAHPYELSYYSPLVGGLRGATTAGFERQYYDVLYLALADWLQKQYGSTPDVARPTVRVHFLPNNKEYARTFPYLHRSGRLAPNVVISDLGSADLLVLTHERRWREYPQLYERYQGRPVLWELAVDRVPLLTVHALR